MAIEIHPALQVADDDAPATAKSGRVSVPMTSDLDIYRTANLLVKQYGEDTRI